MDLSSFLQVFQPASFQGQGLSPSVALENATFIHEVFKVHIDQSKVGEHVEQIFADGGGLVPFLRDKLTVKEFNKSKEKILEIFKFILINGEKDRRWRSQVSPFCLRIHNIVVLYWRHPKESARNQQLALDCLIAEFEIYGDAVVEDEFKLSELYWELLAASEKSSFQPTVRGKMFPILGLIASMTHEGLFQKDEYLTQLHGHVLHHLTSHVNGVGFKAELTIIEGCFKAMDKLLTTFTAKIQSSGDTLKQFYDTLHKVVNPACSITFSGDGQKIKRRESQRVGLELLANHAGLFGADLFSSYQQWYRDLMAWSKSNNASDSSVGRKAMFAFLNAVFGYASVALNTEPPTEASWNAEFCSFFIDKFLETLDSETPRRNEIIVAITGVGLLASLGSNTEQFVPICNKIFDTAGKISLELNNPIVDKYHGSLSMLSTYLETISALLLHCLPEGDEPQEKVEFLKRLNLVEQLTIHLFNLYPQMADAQRRGSHHCFLKIVRSLQLKHSHHCVPFIDRVLRLVLVQIMAAPTSAELEILRDAWKEMQEASTNLSSDTKKKKDSLGLKGVDSYLWIWINMANAKTEPVAAKLVYDRVLTWILDTIDKLELDVITDLREDCDDDLEATSGDIFSYLKPTKPKDFQIFQNIVDFFITFIGKTNDSMFANWVSICIEKLISGSSKNPLVSGFYRMLGVAMKTASRLKIFEAPEYEDLREKCSHFMKSMISKMSSFRDDLMISVLELYLSAPHEILLLNFRNWNYTMQKIFKMGRASLPLADKACDALLGWMAHENIPREVLEEIVKSLFPIWQTYFLSDGRRLSIKAKRQTKEDTEALKENEDDKEVLRKIQLKLLKIFGSFAHIFDHDNDIMSDLDTDVKLLKCAIPLGDKTFYIHLDSIMTRLLKLCEGSAERQTRTAACELLHTCFLYLLGKSVHTGKDEDQPIVLFTKMFTAIMQLSADLDLLVRQMFNPLASQAIHWFTRKKNKYSETILRILFDGLVADDASLRDFSGDSLHEYFRYSTKYNNGGLKEDVIRYVIALSTHSNDNFRLAASMAFNSFYRGFREDAELYNRYTMILLTSFVTSLGVTDNVDEDSIIVKSCKASISHLERILTKKKFNFNADIGKRKQPPGFQGKSVRLNDLAEWLMIQLPRTEVILRDECRRILVAIAPLLKDCGSLQNFVKSWACDEVRVVEVAEQFLSHDSSESLPFPQRVGCVTAAAEFYELLFDNQAISPEFIQYRSSLFLSYVDSVTKPNTEITPADVLLAVGMCKALRGVYHGLSESQKNQFIQFVWRISRAVEEEEHILALLTIIHKTELTSELQDEIRSSLSSVEWQSLRSLTERMRNLKWMRIVGEVGLPLRSGISLPESIHVKDVVWNSLMQKLYGYSEDNTASPGCGPYLPELEEMFRICIAFGINDDTVIDAIFNPGSLDQKIIDIDPSCTTKGERFQKSLSKVLVHPKFLDFRKMSDTVRMEKIVRYIEILISSTSGNKFLRTKYGNDLYENILRIWRPIAVNCEPFSIARILSGMMIINPQGCQNNVELCQWWCGPEVMGAVNTELHEKTQFVGFMGQFLTSSDSTVAETTRAAVERAINQGFPKQIDSRENEECLLKFVGQIVAVVEQDRRNCKIIEVLCLFISKLSDAVEDGKQFNFLFSEVSHRLFIAYKEGSGSNKLVNNGAAKIVLDCIAKCQTSYQSYRLFLYCLLPILRASGSASLKIFLRENIGHLMDILQKTPAAATPTGSSSAQQLHFQALVYDLLALAAERLGGSYMTELNSQYLTVQEMNGIPDSDRKSIAKVVSAVFQKVKHGNVHQSAKNNAVIREATLKRNSAAYYTLALLLSYTDKPNQQRMMEGFLIFEDRKKQYLWENIVDCTADHKEQFKALLEFEEDSSKAFQAGSQGSQNLSNILSFRATQSAKMRGNLTQSSLADGFLFSFDFTGATAANDATFYHQLFGSKRKQQTEEQIPLKTTKLIAINQEIPGIHRDSLSGLVCTIRKLMSFATEDNPTVPDWMKYLVGTLSDSSSHANVKNFILCALLNCQEDLKPYAESFIEPICNIIVNNECKWNEPFNYFAKDLLIMLLEWNEVAFPKEKKVTELLSFVVKQIVEQRNNNENRNDLLENNMNILETICRLWKVETLQVPYDDLLGLLYSGEEPKRKLGLQLCSSVLKGAGVCVTDNPSRIVRLWCKELDSSQKQMYTLASENLGRTLGILKKVNYVDIEKVHNLVVEKLRLQQQRQPAFLVMLRQIQMNYNDVLRPFEDNLLRMVGYAYNLDALEILFSHLIVELKETNSPENLVSSFLSNLSGRKAFGKPCETVEEAKLGTEILELAVQHSKVCSTKILLDLCNWLQILQDVDDISLQLPYYRCVSAIYYTADLNSSNQHHILEIFVNALKEDKPELQVVIDEFWGRFLEEQKDPQKLVLHLMDLLSSKKEAVGLVLSRILQKCSSSNDFSKEVFDGPLKDCIFHDYSLDTSWKARQATFLPLFAESISTQKFTGLPEPVQASLMRKRLSVSQFGVNMLRATLSQRQMQFSLTQGTQPDTADAGPRLPEVEDMEVDGEGPGQGQENPPPSMLSHLKKKFYRHANPEAFFAYRQQQRSAQKRSEAVDRVIAKRNIKMSRAYRIGEVPDIMMKHSDLLTTLFKLGKMDDQIGRVLLREVLSVLINNESVAQTYFEKMLRNSLPTSAMAAVVFDISIQRNILLPPSLARLTSAHHDMYELGIMLLEKHMKVHIEEDRPSSAKRARLDESIADSTETILHLARIYQDFEEFDVLKGLFNQLSERDESSKYSDCLQALSFESDGSMDDALELYSDIMNTQTNRQDYDEGYSSFIEKAYLKCLKDLSKWDHLLERSLQCSSVNSSTWDLLDTNRSATRKSAIAQACLMTVLSKSVEEPDSQIDIKEYLEHFTQLESELFMPEKATLQCFIETDNFHKISIMLDQFWNSAGEKFADILCLSKYKRKEQMLKYQLASTAEDIVTWLRNVDQGNVESLTNRLLVGFEKLYGDPKSERSNSEIVVSTRTCFLKKLSRHRLLVEEEQLSKQLSSLNFHQNLWVLSLCLRDGNATVAHEFIAKTKTLGDDVLPSEFISWRKLYISHLGGIIQSSDTDRDEWFKMWTSAWKKVKIGNNESQEATPSDVILMQAKLLTNLTRAICVRSDDGWGSVSDSGINKAVRVKGSACVKDAATATVSKFFDVFEQQENLSDHVGFEVLAFIDELHRQYPNKYSDNQKIRKIMFEMLILCISSEKREGLLMIPRLLSLLESYSELRNYFLTGWKKIPVWKFLPWIDQLMTAHDSDENMKIALHPILEEVAKVYPDSLYHQFPHMLPKRYQNFHSKYSRSLQALVLPTSLHKPDMDQLMVAIRSKDESLLQVHRDRLMGTLQQILDDRDIFGLIHIRFAEEMLQLLGHHTGGIDGHFEFDEFKSALESIKSAHEKKVFPDGSDGTSKIRNLKEFSPWLAKFHHFQADFSIRFPGMFDDLRQPDMDAKPFIVSFNPTVSVFHSLQLPIRISILGNDGKQRSYLAKFGDDLRQDRRIQQLFRTTNEFFENNSSIRERNISIQTYSVTPLNSSFGLIEWIDKTSSLSSFLINSKKLEEAQTKSIVLHQQWLEKTSGLSSSRGNPIQAIYCTSARKCKKVAAEQQFHQLQAIVPNSLLKDHLLERCPNYENFFHVRQNFIRSYAAMCTVHWLLGIGDRHLQNSLISLESGRVIGIDFGRAFEIGNIGLPIPEIIPFRLTPNLLNLMEPYGCKGLFKEIMIKVWKCLLGWSDVITFVITTLVNERNIGWNKLRMDKEGLHEEGNASVEDWAPLQTIRDKLASQNPVSVLTEVLKSNKWKEVSQVYCDIVKEANHPLRSKDGALSPEEVVDVLLDLARDENILVRLYFGLLSWI